LGFHADFYLICFELIDSILTLKTPWGGVFNSLNDFHVILKKIVVIWKVQFELIRLCKKCDFDIKFFFTSLPYHLRSSI
jgi:hypothetical protein